MAIHFSNNFKVEKSSRYSSRVRCSTETIMRRVPAIIIVLMLKITNVDARRLGWLVWGLSWGVLLRSSHSTLHIENMKNVLALLVVCRLILLKFLMLVNFHTHTNYLTQIKYIQELVLWIPDNVSF
jgi:hypothetical protein